MSGLLGGKFSVWEEISGAEGAPREEIMGAEGAPSEEDLGAEGTGGLGRDVRVAQAPLREGISGAAG